MTMRKAIDRTAPGCRTEPVAHPVLPTRRRGFESGRERAGTPLRPLLAALALALAGCAGSYEPIIDTKGVDQARYRQDLTECRQYAEQIGVGSQTAGGTVLGGLFGGALGAVAGAFGGDAGGGAALGASIGGITGGAGGASGAVHDQKTVIDNCLRHRGYAVLR